MSTIIHKFISLPIVIRQKMKKITVDNVDFQISLVKCNPAVGAATAPILFAKNV